MTSAQSPQSTPRRPSTAPAHGTVPAVCTSLKAKKEEHSRDLSTNSLAASRLGKSAAVDDGQNPAGERHVPSPSQDELLTFPRFEPHPLVQPTLFSTDNTAGGVALNSEGVFTGGKEGIHEGGEGDQDVASKGARLLNAWEKIDELEGLVQSSRADNKRQGVTAVGWVLQSGVCCQSMTSLARYTLFYVILPDDRFKVRQSSRFINGEHWGDLAPCP